MPEDLPHLPISRCEFGGEAGIRTLDTAFRPYNGLANRRLQPLGHLTASSQPFSHEDRLISEVGPEPGDLARLSLKMPAAASRRVGLGKPVALYIVSLEHAWSLVGRREPVDGGRRARPNGLIMS